ncbi:metallophosphoesterase [Pseudomonas sp. 148P]|uniref:Metallophosphoesterase n=1 Tax=Pseudomonas ulcerans TaxID=3115852 RepID=A0ABU7HWZ2_9PSED|nr:MULTISPECIES: metallophosphoesterase [unclassified Pseudomonas]MEE1924423.1 metallophosphoesterase [Pseudomonas sp. 147P]MEE1936026.1 metallophosphoesterase [Pseudomonas sp. 148P]
MSGVIQVARNSRGRDLAVGDVHGHFSRLREALERVDFDPVHDRLFSVGDLVDRGPECEDVLDWLDQPWFHAVQGNHEALAVSHVRGEWLDYALYRAAGGGWFLDLDEPSQARFAERFAQLPLALEVDTAQGPVGLLHADCPLLRWRDLLPLLRESPIPEKIREVCQWSRQRLKDENARGIDDLRALLVGHTPLREVRVLGNVWHIDTGGWSNGHFTLLDLATLEVV